MDKDSDSDSSSSNDDSTPISPFTVSGSSINSPQSSTGSLPSPIYIFLKDDPQKALVVSDILPETTVKEVLDFISDQFKVRPEDLEIQDLDGNVLPVDWIIHPQSLRDNAIRIVCKSASDISKIDLSLFKEQMAEFDGLQEVFESPSLPSPSPTSSRHLSFLSPPSSSSSSGGRPQLLGSFFDVRSVKTPTELTGYQGSGLLC